MSAGREGARLALPPRPRAGVAPAGVTGGVACPLSRPASARPGSARLSPPRPAAEPAARPPAAGLGAKRAPSLGSASPLSLPGAAGQVVSRSVSQSAGGFTCRPFLCRSRGAEGAGSGRGERGGGGGGWWLPCARAAFSGTPSLASPRCGSAPGTCPSRWAGRGAGRQLSAQLYPSCCWPRLAVPPSSERVVLSLGREAGWGDPAPFPGSRCGVGSISLDFHRRRKPARLFGVGFFFPLSFVSCDMGEKTSLEEAGLR